MVAGIGPNHREALTLIFGREKAGQRQGFTSRKARSLKRLASW
jgi:hypothetical protein